MKDKRVRYRQMLTGFFLIMLFFTILSRIYDTNTVPKVTTASVQRKNFTNKITGTGTIKAGSTDLVAIDAGYQVDSVLAAPGDFVKAGDTLFLYQMTSLLEIRESLQLELDKLILNLDKERVSAERYPNVTQEELALQELAIASLELEQSRADYDRAWVDYQDRIQTLKEEYERKSYLTEEELWNENQRQYIANRNTLDDAKQGLEEALREAERKVEDAEEELAQLVESGALEEEMKQAEKRLARAEEDRKDRQNSGENRIESARDQLEFAGELMDRINSGTTTGQIALKEAYEEQLKQADVTLQSAKDNVTALEKTVAKADQTVTNGRKMDTHTNLTNQQTARLSELTQKGIQMDIDRKKKEIHLVDAKINQKGIVSAPTDGMIITQEILPGKRTNGEERLELAVGTLLLEGSFDKKEQKLTQGDKLSITLPGENRQTELQITRISLLEEDGTFWAEFPRSDVSIGTATTYQCQKQSEIYQQVIPLGALRKDNKGYYILAAEARKTILGEEFYAVRKEVTLLHAGDTEAAVAGSLFTEDAIIEKSSQVVNESDRVRVVKAL